MNQVPAKLDPALVDDAGAAALLSVSRSHFQKLEAGGSIGPAPVRLARSKRWCVDELRRWARAGCPPRVRWVERAQAE